MSTITKEFTKEQLIEKLKHRISVASGFPDSEKAQMDLELARIALAAQAAGPVYQWRERYEDSDLWDDCNKEQYEGFAKRPDVETRILYTAPPEPVSVPDDVSGPLAHAYKELTPTFMRNHIDVFERYGIYPDGSAGIQAMRIALDGMNRRAAMLQGAEPVSQPYMLPAGVSDAINRLLDSDGCRGRFSAIECHEAHEELERLLAAAPQQEVK
ncbi:hypothetical protein DOZ52_13390 [Enterobacter hormaechei]|uniref:hypothetical protein n=1 Tax=Enterobacter hormaechei TaxID=158836 RepID=UPI000DC03217|nr:hypothetical protein [Enterobacter hormaechei]RAM42236.1 hypothetical protein DOZ52_13390 [Enterobacter hormaechei]